MKRLFILGNGFDRAHSNDKGKPMPTSYWDFKEYLKENDSEYLASLREVNMLSEDELWKSFESGLAKIDYESIRTMAFSGTNTIEELGYDPCDDEGARYIVDNLLGYYHELSDKIHSWIDDTISYDVNKILNDKYLNEDSVWFTFNYTDTLEEVYNINEDNILHVHGRAANYNDELIMGFCDEDDKISENLTKDDDPYDKEQSIDNGVLDYMEKVRKPVEKLIKDNEYFFKNNSNVDEIYILGFSFGTVDMPYINKFISESPSAKIYVSIYSSKDTTCALEKLFDNRDRVNFMKIEGLSVYPPHVFKK